MKFCAVCGSPLKNDMKINNEVKKGNSEYVRKGPAGREAAEYEYPSQSDGSLSENGFNGNDRSGSGKKKRSGGSSADGKVYERNNRPKNRTSKNDRYNSDGNNRVVKNGDDNDREDAYVKTPDKKGRSGSREAVREESRLQDPGEIFVKKPEKNSLEMKRKQARKEIEAMKEIDPEFVDPLKEQKKKTEKVLVITLIILGVLLFACVVLGIVYFSLYQKWVKLEPLRENTVVTEPAGEVPQGFSVYNSEKYNVSMLYPAAMTISEQDNGIYLVAASSAFMIVDTVNEKTLPDAYFPAYKEMLNASYDNVELSDVTQLQVGDKIVYMVRGKVTADGKEQPIDRYIELYEDRYVEYTVMCSIPGEIDNIVNSVISTLIPQSGVYQDSAAK